MPLNVASSKSKEGKGMKKKLLLPLCLGIFFLLPNLSRAECTDIGYFNSFLLEGTNTVILYAGSTPVVRFDVQNCDVRPTSKIRLIRTNVCDGDEIMIDGKRCVMMQIKPIGP
jgi:hypothetical protein